MCEELKALLSGLLTEQDIELDHCVNKVDRQHELLFLVNHSDGIQSSTIMTLLAVNTCQADKF